MTATKTSALMELFDSFDRKDLAGGYAVALIQDRQVLFKKAYGFANHEYGIPFTPQTVFDFASVAKQFTGYCMADLLQTGQLALEEDIRTYLPELPDYGHTITIRHLLGHTSGLRDWFPLVKLAGRGMNDTLTETYLMKLICRQQALNFIPGSQFAYSNSGYFLLAQIIHRATGKHLGAFAKERIFDPLGMKDSFFVVTDGEIIANRAAPYMRTGDGVYRQGSSRLTSAGSSSLFSTLDDMTLWVLHLDTLARNDDPLLARMLTPIILNDGKPVNYNFGITRGDWRGHAFLAHGGGWNGFASDVSYFPVERAAIIFITNRSPNYVNTHHAVREILLDEPHLEQNGTVTPSVKGVDHAPDPTDWEELVGDYFSSEIQTGCTIQVKDGHLTASHLVNDDVTLAFIADDKFSGNRYWFEEATFTRDAAGKVDGFLVSADSGNLMKNLRFVRA